MAPFATLPESTKGRRARARATLYAVLARALSCPDGVLCAAVAEGALQEVVEEAVAALPRGHWRLGLPRLGVEHEFASDQRSLRDLLLIEYTRLFGTDLLCPHYEADYVGADSFKLVPLIGKVTAFYTTFGLRVSETETGTERPDYIAVELEFMNFLAQKEAHAAARNQRWRARLCRRAQTKFMREHLGGWGRPFARQLGEASRSRFYHDVQALLEAFLLADATYLGLSLEDIEREARSPSRRGKRVDGGAEDAAVEVAGGCTNCTSC
jgi:TorA maturation chaperone TorD